MEEKIIMDENIQQLIEIAQKAENWKTVKLFFKDGTEIEIDPEEALFLLQNSDEIKSFEKGS